MTAFEGRGRATLLVVLIAIGAAGLWFALARGGRVRAGTEATADAPAEAPASSRATSGDMAAAESTRPAPERASVAPTPNAAPPSRAGAGAATPRGTGRVRGRVAETSGAPIESLSVWLVPTGADGEARYLTHVERASDETLTGAGGRFEFEGVPSGRWLVGPAPMDLTALPDEESIPPMAEVVDVRSGELAPEVELRVQRGLVIRGRVWQPDGFAASSGVVSARSPDVRGLCYATIRSDGAFTLGPLVGGQYELWADGEDEGTTSAVVGAFAGAEDAVLHLRAGGSLSGRVIGAEGEGVAAVTVLALREDVEAHQQLSTTSEADGRFRFDNVAPGRYQLLAETADARFASLTSVDVAAGGATEELALALRAGGWLRIRHASTESVHVDLRSGDVRVLATDLAEQDTRIGVPAGRVTVRWTIGAEAPGEQEFEIVAGAEQELVLAERMLVR